MIEAKLSTVVTSGDKIEIERRGEVGFFILYIFI